MAIPGLDTIVFLMMENRSFDHMLGHLSLGPNPMEVEGLSDDQEWRDSYANIADGTTYPLKPLQARDPIPKDPPHGFQNVKIQIETPPADPACEQMGGFAATYKKVHQGADPSIVMGYYEAGELPMYDFFARNFRVCDHWFAALPAGTQPNRLMAMAGYSKVAKNKTPMEEHVLAYDWLDQQGADWRCYHWGDLLPFFTMMVNPWGRRIVRSIADGDGNFRRYKKFRADWNSAGPAPAVVFLEPQLLDVPLLGKPNDDHPKAPVTRGQKFIRQVYSDLVSNPARWARTLLIVTYDEHGGFFDHVWPRRVTTEAGGETFHTTGPRVPAFLVSPLVEKGLPFVAPLDHTSFLSLLAEHLGDPEGYSPAVKDRQFHFGKISDALRSTPRGDGSPPPPGDSQFAALAEDGPVVPTAPDTPNAAAMDQALRQLRAEMPEEFKKSELIPVNTYLDSHRRPIPRNVDHVD
jgi:phospholipase C